MLDFSLRCPLSILSFLRARRMWRSAMLTPSVRLSVICLCFNLDVRVGQRFTSFAHIFGVIVANISPLPRASHVSWWSLLTSLTKANLTLCHLPPAKEILVITWLLFKYHQTSALSSFQVRDLQVYCFSKHDWHILWSSVLEYFYITTFDGT